MATVKQQRNGAKTPKRPDKLAKHVMQKVLDSGLYFHLGNAAKLRALYEALYRPANNEEFEFGWRIMRGIQVAQFFVHYEIEGMHPAVDRMIEMANIVYKLPEYRALSFIDPHLVYRVYEVICNSMKVAPISYDNFVHQWQHYPKSHIIAAHLDQNAQIPCESWEIHFGFAWNAAIITMGICNDREWLDYDLNSPLELLNDHLDNNKIFSQLYSLYLDECDAKFHISSVEDVSISLTYDLPLNKPAINPLSEPELKDLIRMIIRKS